MTEQPTSTQGYYAIIPANVRYDKDLSPNQKLLYGEITALTGKEGYCWATNTYFAELYGVTAKTVSTWVSGLEKKGYVKRQVVRDENGVVTQRRLWIIEPSEKDTPPEKKDTLPLKNGKPSPEKKGEGIPENVKENNTSINNTSMNNTSINKYIGEERPSPSTESIKKQLEEVEDVSLRETLLEFIESRKQLKKPVTDLAFKRLLNKLNKLADTPEEKREIVEKSIISGWTDVYPLKKEKQKQSVQDYYDKLDAWAMKDDEEWLYGQDSVYSIDEGD